MTDPTPSEPVARRFAPSIAERDGGLWEVDISAGEFRQAIAAYVLAAAEGDVAAMTIATDRVAEVAGDRGVSTTQLVDALVRVTMSIATGGPELVRAEIAAAAAFTVAALNAQDGGDAL